ncbi:MAG: hypothetical protein M0D57_04510 [Sphingobacteriales bacterium JAD_PAG50586_3]|nr:MAG: hypothetical protein M0D57_04510 [Sphingobacteriales bacterium JAD_PAG50586_3]
MKHKGNTDKGLTFHIYDVNLTVIKQRLGRALDSEFDEYSIGRTEYINSINLYIENFCEKRGLDILAVSALIVKPNDDEYGLSLALHLSWCATSSIRLILDQLNIDYPKDKLSFTDLLRNHICPLIISSCPNKSKDDRVYQVINWIEKKRLKRLHKRKSHEC